MRIAVLIDAENMPVSAYKDVALRLARQGTVLLARAVGDFSRPQLSQWCQQGPALGIDLELQPGCGKLKNGADIALAAEAMQIALSGRFDTVALVSGDGDFTPLAVRIRRLGLAVFGFARQGNASAQFKAACTEFTVLDDPVVPRAAAAKPSPPQKPPVAAHHELTAAERAIVSAMLLQACAGSTHVPASRFAGVLRQQQSQIAARIGGKGKLLRNLVSLGLAEAVMDGKTAMLRLPQSSQTRHILPFAHSLTGVDSRF